MSVILKNKTKNFFATKDTVNQVKRQATERPKIAAEWESRTHKQPLQINQKETNNLTGTQAKGEKSEIPVVNEHQKKPLEQPRECKLVPGISPFLLQDWPLGDGNLKALEEGPLSHSCWEQLGAYGERYRGPEGERSQACACVAHMRACVHVVCVMCTQAHPLWSRSETIPMNSGILYSN